VRWTARLLVAQNPALSMVLPAAAGRRRSPPWWAGSHGGCYWVLSSVIVKRPGVLAAIALGVTITGPFWARSVAVGPT
jgi:hypothetical protein